MAPSSTAVDALFEAAEARRSLYTITKKSPISDARIQEIVEAAIKHAPSAFNVQSARAVLLLGAEHDKLWDIASAVLKKAMPEQAFASLSPKLAGFKGGYGTVMWFEDEVALNKLREKNAAIANVVTEWSDHSNGMHQFLVWTALTQLGFGCNLQHYNFAPDFAPQVTQTWNLSPDWKLKAQLVFGETTTFERRHPRTYLPIEGERLLVFGA